MLSVLQMTIDADMNEEDIEQITEHMNPFDHNMDTAISHVLVPNAAAALRMTIDADMNEQDIEHMTNGLEPPFDQETYAGIYCALPIQCCCCVADDD